MRYICGDPIAVRSLIAGIALGLFASAAAAFDQEEMKQKILTFTPALAFCEAVGAIADGNFNRQSCVSGFSCRDNPYVVRVRCIEKEGALLMDVDGLPGGALASRFQFTQAQWSTGKGSILLARFARLEQANFKPRIIGIEESADALSVKYEVLQGRSVLQAGTWVIKNASYLHQLYSVDEVSGAGITVRNVDSLIETRP